VTRPTTVSRADVLALLAGYGDRDPQDIGEELDSLELAWLVHAAEQRFAVSLGDDDETLLRLSTVDGAVAVLREVLGHDPNR
jgi:acyl carrier protein